MKEDLAFQINVAYDRLRLLRERQRELDQFDLSRMESCQIRSINESKTKVSHDLQDTYDEIERLKLLISLEKSA